jgi:ABC-type glutathione transport system ATPase component
MRADHILVVMNGEIIEQGSHDDLIHSKGKYHDLWSKQIFVKPATDRSRSRSKSPTKKDANIVNDLTPIRHKVELAKVMKTVADAECPKEDDTTTEDGKKPEGSHLREVSPAEE